MISGPTRPRHAANWIFVGIFVSLVSSFHSSRVSAADSWSIGPVPEWVDPQRAETDPTHTADGEIYRRLLKDTQCNALGEVLQTYHHQVRMYVDQVDLQEDTGVDFEYDPQYEQFTLHFVRILRDGRAIDCLKPENIRVLQRETELEMRMYNGRVSLNVVLEDVQKGDILEVACTRSGQNPVFDGRFMDSVVMHSAKPVLRSRYRLLWPEDRPLYKKEHGAAEFSLQVQQHEGWREFLWEELALPELDFEGGTPSWYTIVPWLQLSEFDSWGEVVQWGQRHFAEPRSLSRPLQDRIERIRREHLEDEARALAAFRFVNEEIRYLGIEVGPGAYAPRPPNEVFRSRFGDCKDKSYLLATILQRLDIEATPALVCTWSERHVSDWHPSPLAFDHVVVRALVKSFLGTESKEYWLDPTRLYARGSLAELSAVEYERALIIADGVDALVDIESLEDRVPTVDVQVQLDIGLPSEATRMNVTTVYRGAEANFQRYLVRSTSTDKLSEQYLDYYSTWFDSMETSARLEVQDDEEENRIEMHEKYVIVKFWEDTQEGGTRAFLLPFEVYDRIPVLSSQERSTPFAVAHPSHIKYQLTATFDVGWQVEPEHTESTGPAATFLYDVRAAGDRLRLLCEYRTLSDHVSPEKWGEHVEQMGEIREALWFPLEYSGTSLDEGLSVYADHQNWNWSLLILGGLVSLGWTLLMVRIWRSRDQPAELDIVPRPIGGWLILIGIGVFVGPFNFLYGLISELSVYSVPQWTELTVPGGSVYHAMWAPLLLFELVGNLGFLAAWILLLLAFLKRKAFFPAVFIWCVSLNWLFQVVDLWLFSLGPDTVSDGSIGGASQIVLGGVFTVVWIFYMASSERVRQTFVR